MNIEELEARKIELFKLRQQAIDSLNQIDGALMEVEHWISRERCKEIPKENNGGKADV